MVFGANPVDLFGRDDGDEDVLFAQNASLSGKFAQQWELRAMALEAATKKVANSQLRRLLERNKSSTVRIPRLGILRYLTRR